MINLQLEMEPELEAVVCDDLKLRMAEVCKNFIRNHYNSIQLCNFNKVCNGEAVLLTKAEYDALQLNQPV